MEYRYLEQGDEALIAGSELPCEEGIALAVRTTGYEHERDEVVELAVCDLDGQALFSQKVKPQNVEVWQPGPASGGLAPADLSDAPELFQFEDEVSGLFEGARVVVACHLAFAEGAIEASWVSLPAFEHADLVELFCASHCAADYPGQQAATAALDGMAAYYGLPAPDGTAAGEAACAAACYRALVDEHKRVREGKGAAHWARYEEGKASERAEEERARAVRSKREHRMNQMNGLLWLAGALIFISLAIQLYQRGGDVGVMVIAGAIAVFAVIRAVANFRK